MKINKSTSVIVTVLLILGLSAFASAKDASPEKTISILKGKININTATDKELQLLPGIGKKTATNIIEYRTQNGNYTEVKSLLKVKGVGKKTLEKITGFIIFEGETTLTKKKPIK